MAGTYSPSPGVIYPTLTLLEELGHVTVSTGDGAKKLHAITAEGRAYLEATARPWMPSSPAWKRPVACMAAVPRHRSCARWRT